MPCATDSWSMSIRYRCRVAKARASPAVCENPISSRAPAATPMVGVLRRKVSALGSCGEGRPRGTCPTSATPCAPRSKPREARIPPATSTSAPGIGRRAEPQGQDHGQRDGGDQDGRPVDIAQRSHPRAELAPGVQAVRVGPRQLGQLADHHVHRRPRQEARDHRLGQEPRDPSQPEHGEQQEEGSRDERDRRHQLRRVLSRRPRSAAPLRRRPRPATSWAPSRSAARCRTARRGWPRPPRRRARSPRGCRRCPRSRGSWARSALSRRSRR